MKEDVGAIVVTAAAGTIGTAVVTRLLDATSSPLILVDSDGDHVHALGTRIGGRAIVVVADATDEHHVQRYVAAYVGPITGLVNCVGGEGDAMSIPEHSIASFERTFRLNVSSALIHMKYVIPRMVSAGFGSIVNIGSVSSRLGNPNDVSYTVAKHGIIGLTRAGAAEWGHRGIRVNSVCPSPIEGPLMERFEATQPEGLLGSAIGTQPKPRPRGMEQQARSRTPYDFYCLTSRATSMAQTSC